MELKEVFEPIVNFLKNFQRKDKEVSKDKAKERLQLVLMQDRASVSPDFFEMMKKEIIEVIKKYIEIDEETLEVQLTRGFEGEDGTGPALYANIPIKNIKPVARKVEIKEENTDAAEAKEPTAEELANTIIDEIKVVAEEKQSGNKKNKKNKKGNNIQKAEEKIEEVVEEVNEQTVDVVETVEEVKSGAIDKMEEVADEVTLEVEDTAKDVEDSKSNFKEKLTGVKTGMQDTFSKMKTSAKEGIEKIKSKVKAKN